jgi:hypothetical protein
VGGQAVGKVPMSVNDMKIDLMSISGHKVRVRSAALVFGCGDLWVVCGRCLLQPWLTFLLHTGFTSRLCFVL